MSTRINRSTLVRLLEKGEQSSPLAASLRVQAPETLESPTLEEAVNTYQSLGNSLTPDEAATLQRTFAILQAGSLFGETSSLSQAVAASAVQRDPKSSNIPSRLPAFSSAGAPRIYPGTKDALPARAWVSHTSSVIGGLPVLAQRSKRIYTLDSNGTVYGFNLVNGDRELTHDFGKHAEGTPALSTDEKTLYFVAGGGPDSFLYALDLEKNETRWWARLSGLGGSGYLRCSPTLSPDGTSLFAMGADGYLRCLDAASGELRWPPVYTGNTTQTFGSSPVVSPDGGQVSVMDDSGRIQTFDARLGTPLWSTSNGSSRGASGTGLYTSDGRLLLLPSSDALHAFDSQTGEQRWKYPVRLGGSQSPICTSDGRSILIPSSDQSLHVIETSTGEAAKAPIFHPAGKALVGAPALAKNGTHALAVDWYGGLVSFDLENETAQGASSMPGLISQYGFVPSTNGRFAIVTSAAVDQVVVQAL